MNGTALVDLRTAVATLGCFAFSFNAATVLHETGHLLAALLTGGRVRGGVLHPFGSSSVWIDPDPWPAATHSAGVAFAAAAGLLWLSYTWPWRSRGLWAMGHSTAVLALGTSGIGLAVGAFLLEGDAGALVQLGAPRGLLVLAGAALAAAAVPAGALLLILLGVRPDAGFAKRLLVCEAGVLPYLLAILAIQAGEDRSVFLVWLPMVAAGALVVAGMAAIAKPAGRWAPEAAPLSWRQALSFLAAGVLVVATLSWAF